VLEIKKLPSLEVDAGTNEDIAGYIPIVAHYDESTLITRNGEIIQTIAITSDKMLGGEFHSDIREIIRKAVCESVDSKRISVTTHIIRGRRDLTRRKVEEKSFVSELSSAWIKLNNFDKQLVNTIYVSFVYQSSYSSIFNALDLLKSVFFSPLKRRHLAKLEKNHGKLKTVTDSFIENAKSLCPIRLGLLESEEGLISEQLMLYHYLSHLEERKVHLPIQDFSKYLANFDVSFGFNSLQINSHDNNQYAAIFSFKDHYLLSSRVLDKLMHLGAQFAITQHHIFTSKHEANSKYKSIADIATLSKSYYINTLSGYDRVLGPSGDNVTDYSKLYSYILVHSDDDKFFQDKIKQVTKVFREEGILVVREDFTMPSLFWAQMPGNCRYLPQQRYICADNTSIGSYASIYHNKSGNYKGSAWGEPVAILRSFEGVPFYFNFHNSNGNGSTLIIGPSDSGKSTISRFLLAHSVKYNPNVLYFDFSSESKAFADSIGLKMFNMEDIKAAFKINPFAILGVFGSEHGLSLWIAEALGLSGPLYIQYKDAVDAIALRLFESKDIVDKVGAIGAMIESLNDAAISRRFDSFFKDPEKFDAYFKQDGENFSISAFAKMQYFNIAEMEVDKVLFHTYFGLFFDRIIEQLDGSTPTIIYINDLVELLKTSFIQENFGATLKKVQSKNAIIIGTMQRNVDLESSAPFLNAISGFGTRIFMSDKYADKYFKRAYNLDEDDLHKIKSYASSRRIFLLKQDHISSVISLNLAGLGDFLTTLASKP